MCQTSIKMQTLVHERTIMLQQVDNKSGDCTLIPMLELDFYCFVVSLALAAQGPHGLAVTGTHIGLSSMIWSGMMNLRMKVCPCFSPFLP